MKTTRTIRHIGAAATALVLLAGCGSSGGSDGDRTTTTGGADRVTTTTGALDETTTSEAAGDGGEAKVRLPGKVTTFTEDFQDDRNGWIGDQSYAGSPVVPKIADGVLTMSGSDRGALDMWADRTLLTTSTAKDQEVRVSVKIATGGAASLECRVDTETSLPKGYLFSMTSAGTFHIRKYDGVKESPDGLATNPPEVLQQLQDGVKAKDLQFTPAVDFSPSETYDLDATCIDVDGGVQLTFYVDGEKAVEFVDRDAPLAQGTGGVSAEASTIATKGEFRPYTVSFDDFSLTTPA